MPTGHLNANWTCDCHLGVTGHVNAMWTLASLKIPLTGVLADWSKADLKTFEAPLIGYEQGFDFLMLLSHRTHRNHHRSM